MIVFIVMELSYEGDSIKGVFSSPEKAAIKQSELSFANRHGDVWFEIKKFEVQE